MKKSILTTLILIITASLLSAFGDKETRSLKSFADINVSTGISATLERGTTNKIDIEVEGIELDKIETSVSNGRLVVKIENNWKLGWSRKRKVKVHITYTEELHKITSSSGSSIFSEETIESGELELEASSGSRLEVNIDTNKLNGESSSGSTLKVSGRATSIDVEASSGSSFGSYDLVSDNADLQASSGSSIKLTVNKSLKADASSGSSVRYRGNPEKTDIDKSSGSSVSRD
jgi:hypothetical protein